jgi:putative transposase
MPRTRRISPDGAIHHVLNRGNRRATIFHKPHDYQVFFNLLCDAMERVPMRILGVCLMPNHFHLVLWPLKGVDLSAYMGWLMNAHVRRYHKHYETTGLGHIWQGRYKNFLVQSDCHLYNVLRYVEGNALRANLVRAAQYWPWSSVNRRYTPDGRSYLSEWPAPRPTDWTTFVNTGESSTELQKLRYSLKRGAPYGDEWWIKDTVREYGLESTVSIPGRRRKQDPIVRAGFE